MCLSAHVEVGLKILALKLAQCLQLLNKYIKNYQTIMCTCLT